jgi:hypothetical protein
MKAFGVESVEDLYARVLENVRKVENTSRELVARYGEMAVVWLVAAASVWLADCERHTFAGATQPKLCPRIQSRVAAWILDTKCALGAV